MISDICPCFPEGAHIPVHIIDTACNIEASFFPAKHRFFQKGLYYIKIKSLLVISILLRIRFRYIYQYFHCLPSEFCFCGRNREIDVNCESVEALMGRSDLQTIIPSRSEEHTSELQSRGHLVCRLLLEKKK